MTRVLRGWRLCIGLSFIFFAGGIEATSLKVGTFNIRWYGLGGNAPAQAIPEFRDTKLKHFLNRELKDADVIAFEEIVDVARFKKNVVPKSMECKTYTHSDSIHQHVVLCYKDKYRFSKEIGDEDFKIEESALGYTRSRPALSGLLKDSKGKGIAHIIAVHLKAYPHETQRRLSQVSAIAKRIGEFKDGLPVVVLGDFNTHLAELTGLKWDDLYLMDEVFKKEGVSLYHVHNPYKYTYRDGYTTANLDHIWVSFGVGIEEKLKVSAPCRSFSKEDSPYSDLSYYNHFVSDHCPVSATLKLPN